MRCPQSCLVSTRWPPLTRGNTSETIIGGHRVVGVDVYHTNRLMLTLDAKFITSLNTFAGCHRQSSVHTCIVVPWLDVAVDLGLARLLMRMIL